MSELQQTKIAIKEKVIAAIKRDGAADQETLAASLAVEHGLSRRTVNNILKDMIKAKFIAVKDGLLVVGGV